MQRVLILGPGGAGKSTLATKLGARLGLPVIHLDQHHWLPGWVPMEAQAWRETVKDLAARDCWVMDGNYSATFDIRMPRADTVVIVEANRFKSIWRAFLRVLRSFGRVRPDMAPGCPERFNLEFFVWLWGFPKHSRPKIDAGLAEHAGDVPVIRLRTDRDVRAFLERAAS